MGCMLCLEGLSHIPWCQHGKCDVSCYVVPFDIHTAKFGGRLINCDCVVLLEGGNEMCECLGACMMHKEVIDNLYKYSSIGLMAEYLVFCLFLCIRLL